MSNTNFILDILSNGESRMVSYMLDRTYYKRKPDRFAGAIMNRLENAEVETSIVDFMKEILAGASFKPAIVGKSNESWKQQELFCLDFDNKKDPYITFQEALQRAKEMNLHPFFAYTTFSHTKEIHKFRLCFLADEVVIDREKRDKLQNALIKAFDGFTDTSTRNAGRLFYGGKDLIHLDITAIINADEIINRFCDEVEQIESSTIQRGIEKYNVMHEMPQGDFKAFHDEIIQAYKSRDAEYLKQLYSFPHTLLENDNAFREYMYAMDMRMLLGLPEQGKFNCIFHDDENPSASIKQDEETRKYIYKCFADGCRVSKHPILDLLNVVEILGKYESRPRALNFIKEILNLEIVENAWTREQKAILDENIRLMMSADFKKIFPEVDKISRSAFRELMLKLCLIAKDNILGENIQTKEGQVPFFASGSHLAKELGISEYNAERIYQRLSLGAFLGMIEKLGDEQIEHLDIFQKALEIQAEKSHTRRVNFLTVNSLTGENQPQIEQKAIEWKEKGYTLRGTTKDMFALTLDAEETQRIYPQEKIVAKDGTIATSRTTDEFHTKVYNIASKLLDEQGYFMEKQITQRLGLLGIKKTTAEPQLKKIIPAIIKELQLQKKRANNKIKDQYNIKGTGYPTLYLKK